MSRKFLKIKWSSCHIRLYTVSHLRVYLTTSDKVALSHGDAILKMHPHLTVRVCSTSQIPSFQLTNWHLKIIINTSQKILCFVINHPESQDKIQENSGNHSVAREGSKKCAGYQNICTAQTSIRMKTSLDSPDSSDCPIKNWKERECKARQCFGC